MALPSPRSGPSASSAAAVHGRRPPLLQQHRIPATGKARPTLRRIVPAVPSGCIRKLSVFILRALRRAVPCATSHRVTHNEAFDRTAASFAQHIAFPIPSLETAAAIRCRWDAFSHEKLAQEQAPCDSHQLHGANTSHAYCGHGTHLLCWAGVCGTFRFT